MSDPRPAISRGHQQPPTLHWKESAWASHGLAVVSVVGATLLMFALYAALGFERGVPFIFYFGAVIFTARYGGRAPGLLSVALSAVAANYFFMGQYAAFAVDFPNLLQVFAFVVVSLFIVSLTDRSARAEDAARASRESLETTLRSIGDAVISTDASGRIAFMNAVAERLTGWTLAEARGRALSEVFPIVNERTREVVESPVEKVLREGRVVGLANHTILLARGGAEVPIDDSGAPIKDERGRTTGVVLVFHDITGRRKSEAALRKSEERFRSLADAAPVMIWISGPDRLAYYFNRPWLEFTGRALEEEAGEGWLEGVHTEDRANLLDTYNSSFEARLPYKIEFRLRRADGQYRSVLKHGVPQFSPAGEFEGYVASCIDIDDRKQAEAERARLAALVESSGDAIIGKTLDGVITSWNVAAEKVYGYSAEEAVGRHISFIVPPERAGELAGILESVGRGESIANLETVRVRKDGSRLSVSLTVSPIRDGAGRPTGASTIARDITGRKRAEEDLRESQARLEGVVESAMDAIITVDSEQRVVLFNRAAEKMFRCAASEAVGGTLDRFIPARLRAEHRGHINSFGRTGVTTRAMAGARAVAGLRSDGEEFPLEASISQIDAGGQKLYTVIMRDITERRAGEERLRFIAEATRVLASSLEYETTLERLARLAVSSLADYCVVDLVGDGGEVRRVAAAHADPAHAGEAEELRLFPPDTSKRAGVPHVLRTGETLVVGRVTGEDLRTFARDEAHLRLLERLGLKSFMTVPLVTRDRVIGAITFALTSASRAYTPSDVSFAEELARRAALAVENARLYRNAQEANRVKDEFLATLSHELRTPLTPIIGWTHMIQSGRLGPAEAGQAIDVIGKNSQSLSRLINDLLDMSSILSGKMRIERAPVEIADVVREAAETVRPQADAHRVALEVNADGLAPAFVNGDRTRLVQVFWNLMNNAVKFSGAGGRVRVRVESREGGASVTVEDEGVGIAPEFLPHVFERFRQADMGTTREHGGLGIGLALVKSFVEAHGGTVSASSAGEGRGSRFTVTLPAAGEARGRDGGGDAGVGAQAACVAEGDSCRVLLVEDARDTLDMLKVVFEARGYATEACGNAEEALRVAESGRFDIIVSDIGLPNVDGYELIGRLRSLPHLRDVPALALTGYAALKDVEAALAAGFDAHVPKPVEPSALAEQVEELLRRKPRGAAES